MSSPDIRKSVPQDAATFVAPTRPELRLVPPPLPETVSETPPVAPHERPSTLLFDIKSDGGSIFLNPEIGTFRGLKGEVTLEPGQLVALGKAIKAKKKELKKAAKAQKQQFVENPKLGLPDRANPPIKAGKANILITTDEYSRKLATEENQVKRPPQASPDNFSSK